MSFKIGHLTFARAQKTFQIFPANRELRERPLRRGASAHPDPEEAGGLLRISSALVILGQETFYAFLSSFLKTTYPPIQADLFITNLFLDLIAENIDVAIRFGELQDLSLIAQRIGKSVRYVVAAPEYLHGRPPPSRPEDLGQHQCVILQGVTTRWNGIWSAARNPSSSTSRGRWRREISRR